MFTKADIRRVNIVIPGADYRELIVMLGKSGLIQIDKDMGDEYSAPESILSDAAFSVFSEKAHLIEATAKVFLSETGTSDTNALYFDSIIEDIHFLFSGDPEADLHEAELIKRKREKYIEARTMIEDEIKSAGIRHAELVKLNEYGIDLSALEKMKHLTYIYGIAGNMQWPDELNKKWFYMVNGDRFLLILPSGEKAGARNILKENGFEELEEYSKSGQSLEEIEEAAKKRIKILKNRLDRLDSFFEKDLTSQRERMFYLFGVYSIILKIAGVESSLGFSSEIIVVNGWIKFGDAEALGSLLGEACGGHFYIRIATHRENRRFRGSIPVLLKNSRLFRPFELLVRMMGFPGNSEVDPTPAAAIAYVVIFGVMFGDAGQGLVLAASGYFLNRYGIKKHGDRNDVSDFGSIMIWCGFSAVIFGFLYGSVFSYEHLLPALLFHPMENMMELFLMAIMTGVVIISAGLVFNIINGMIAGNYQESLFGTKGAAGLAVYLSFIYFTMRYILKGVFPESAELAAAVSLPGAFFCLRGPLGFLLFHEETFFLHGLFEYTVESIIEIIEMFSGFLGNTISFIRAGAFALSHAGLSIAVFTLAGIVDPSMKGIAAVIVIIAGNIFIIVLEGLVCAIQSMRLEYYEFFGKFFKGDGAGFAPFSLRFK